MHRLQAVPCPVVLQIARPKAKGKLDKGLKRPAKVPGPGQRLLSLRSKGNTGVGHLTYEQPNLEHDLAFSSAQSG